MHIRQNESLDYDLMISCIDAVKEMLEDRSIFLCTGTISENEDALVEVFLVALKD